MTRDELRDKIAKVVYDHMSSNIPAGEARWIATDQILALIKEEGWKSPEECLVLDALIKAEAEEVEYLHKKLKGYRGR
jgi:hypothetical protein